VIGAPSSKGFLVTKFLDAQTYVHINQWRIKDFERKRIRASGCQTQLNSCAYISKNVPPLQLAIIFYIHSSIATIFGKNVAEKVDNQDILYFLTTPN